MNKKCEEVSVARSNYEDEYQFWEDVAELIRILTKNDYQILCRLEECGENAVFVAEYNYNETFSGIKARWEDEIEEEEEATGGHEG